MPSQPTLVTAVARVASAGPLPLMLQLATLATLIERLTQFDGEHPTAVPGLTLLRLSDPCLPLHAVHRPALCVIAQGAKHLTLADELYAYDASTFLVVAQDLPVMAHVVQASTRSPYLCVRLDFDPAELAQCALEWSVDHRQDGRQRDHVTEADNRGLFVGALEQRLLDPLLRLVRLLDSPQDINALAPLAMREIIYRLLANEEGWRLRAFGFDSSTSRRVALAIAWLRKHFAEPLRVDDLARVAHMSNSSLHRHFKAVTAMSPLQYQKRLRLIDARRLMLGEQIDAATAADRVGYQSPSQFSRDYSRLFGAPPARDLRAVKERSR